MEYLRAGIEVGSDEISGSGQELVEVSPYSILRLRVGHTTARLSFVLLLLLIAGGVVFVSRRLFFFPLLASV